MRCVEYVARTEVIINAWVEGSLLIAGSERQHIMISVCYLKAAGLSYV
jgi:hypothetical protein